MIKDIKIGEKIIGTNQGIFISAEVGTTCNGDVETAKKLIDAAKDAGMDAVKFQIIDPEKDFSDLTMTFSYRIFSGEEKRERMTEMLKKYMFTFKEWQEIKSYADKRDIIIFATPSHLEAVKIMEKLNMPAYKICAWNVNFYPLIKKMAKYNKPILIDSGPASMYELMRMIDVIKKEGNDKIIILYCCHTDDITEINLKSISYIRNTFNVLSGFSSDDRNFDIDFVTLAYKPVVLEKRLTMDKTQSEHHHSISLEPQEMKTYVKTIRKLETVIGEYGLYPSKKEIVDKEKYYRGIVANRNIKKGGVIGFEDIICKRPKTRGMDPFYYDIIIGRTAKNDIKKNEPITWENI